MNYERHYYSLIDKARSRTPDCYTERHHIVPRCAGGSDDECNLVRLTPEEHYVAHQLLLKMFRGTEYEYQLALACSLMSASPDGSRMNNKSFGWVKRRVSETKKGRPQTVTPKSAAARRARRGKSQEVAEHVCPHCNKTGKGSAMFKHHFDRCVVKFGRRAGPRWSEEARARNKGKKLSQSHKDAIATSMRDKSK